MFRQPSCTASWEVLHTSYNVDRCPARLSKLLAYLPIFLHREPPAFQGRDIPCSDSFLKSCRILKKVRILANKAIKEHPNDLAYFRRVGANFHLCVPNFSSLADIPLHCAGNAVICLYRYLIARLEHWLFPPCV
jgi:hypothetical protein